MDKNSYILSPPSTTVIPPSCGWRSLLLEGLSVIREDVCWSVASRSKNASAWSACFHVSTNMPNNATKLSECSMGVMSPPYPLLQGKWLVTEHQSHSRKTSNRLWYWRLWVARDTIHTRSRCMRWKSGCTNVGLAYRDENKVQVKLSFVACWRKIQEKLTHTSPLTNYHSCSQWLSYRKLATRCWFDGVGGRCRTFHFHLVFGEAGNFIKKCFIGGVIAGGSRVTSASWSNFEA